MNHSVTFPDEYDPNRALIVALLHSAIHEYFYPHTACASSSDRTPEKLIEYKELARRFLFEDSFIIDYGGIDESPNSLLKKANLDIRVVRDMIRLKEKQGINASSRFPLLGGIINE